MENQEKHISNSLQQPRCTHVSFFDPQEFFSDSEEDFYDDDDEFKENKSEMTDEEFKKQAEGVQKNIQNSITKKSKGKANLIKILVMSLLCP